MVGIFEFAVWNFLEFHPPSTSIFNLWLVEPEYVEAADTEGLLWMNEMRNDQEVNSLPHTVLYDDYLIAKIFAFEELEYLK